MSKIVPIPRTLSVFALAMINVAAIGSVKNWPFTAEYGFSSLFYLILAALVFFFPVSLVAAELSTGWPKKGGVFLWVKEAFGHRLGFLAIWLQWIENVVWYPTILSFISATFAYAFDPSLAENKFYTLIMILGIFWGSTLLNFFGMRISGLISTIGAFCGTFFPGILIIVLGFIWFFAGEPMQISFNWQALIPDLTSLDKMVFFTGVLLALAGMEMSAVHARDVKHPQKDYPKAILLSALLILGLSILGVLAIAMVVPQKEISLVAGSVQAISIFMEKYELRWLIPFLAALISVGAIGSMSTWIIGPTKGLLAAAESGDLPPIFRKMNKNGVPTALLFSQAIIVTILSLLFLFMPTVSSGFWILSVLVAELYLIMYLLMFAAAITLRYKKPDVNRPYRVPGGNFGMWVVSSLGMLGSLFALIIGFIPPGQIETGSKGFYVTFLIIGTLLGCLAPFLITFFKKPHWDHS